MDKRDNTVPELGREYHIFDDGKIRPSRHYIAKVVEVIPFDKCADKKLLEAWEDIIKEDRNSISPFAETTDYFIKAISDFDKYPLYFVRTSNGGWFSMDYPTTWMGARLDIDGSLYNIMVEWHGKDGKEIQNG